MSEGKPVMSLTAEPLTRGAYESYGRLIAADDELPWRPANMGTARRFNHLADVENLRGDKAKLNLCIFSMTPLQSLPLEMKLLEKHPYSTQVFLPMDCEGEFLVIVCHGADAPDLTTLRAFVATGAKGVSYFPGVWHYPMTSLGRGIDFTCLVYEDGSKEDCIVQHLPSAILVGV